MSGEHLRLERIAMRARPSFETIELDGWILRFAEGYTKRVNSVNPHFGSTLPVLRKIETCEEAFRSRRLPTIFRLTPFSQPADLDELLSVRGYERLDPSLVLTCELPVRCPIAHLDVRCATMQEWLGAFDRIRSLDPADRSSHHRIVASMAGEPFFAVIDRHDGPIACGLGVSNGDAVGLFDLCVVEAERRRSHGTAIVGAILACAAEAGARTAYLQVHSMNAQALALYRRLGFETAYPYWYRVAPSDGLLEGITLARDEGRFD